MVPGPRVDPAGCLGLCGTMAGASPQQGAAVDVTARLWVSFDTERHFLDVEAGANTQVCPGGSRRGASNHKTADMEDGMGRVTRPQVITRRAFHICSWRHGFVPAEVGMIER